MVLCNAWTQVYILKLKIVQVNDVLSFHMFWIFHHPAYLNEPGSSVTKHENDLFAFSTQ